MELLCGDCLEILPTLPEASVDVVVTSPPYNLDLRYTRYRDSRGEDEYLDWMVAVATAVKRVMKPDASFFLNIAGSPMRPWLPFELIVRLRPVFVLQNHIAWVKSIATTDADTVGHFKPVAGRRFLHHNHEHIFHLTRTGEVTLDRLAVGVPFKDKSNIARRGHAQDRRCRGNTWFIPYRTVQSRREKFDHPGTFPLDLPRWCIRLHGRAGGTVLDPFMGTGTTLLAAAMEGAGGIGIDIDPAYVATARERLAAHFDRVMQTSGDRASGHRALEIFGMNPRVGLFVTCLVDLYRPTVGFAAIKLLRDAGCTVEVPRAQTCCGQPAYNMGDRETARELAAGIVDAFAGFDYVVAPSGSCAGMLRHHLPTLFDDDPNLRGRAHALGEKCHELVSFLTDVMGVRSVPASLAAAATYHDSCSGLRELGVKAQPRALLASVAGLTLTEMKEPEVCCGFGGTFCVKYPEISTRMVSDKTADIEATGADLLLAGDLGCLLNMAGRLKRQGSRVAARHVAEVLAGATADVPPIGEPAG